jgi:hypothetical protein
MKSQNYLHPLLALFILAFLLGGAWLRHRSHTPTPAAAPPPAPEWITPPPITLPAPALPAKPEAPPPIPADPPKSPQVRTILMRGRLVNVAGEAIPLAKVEVFALDLRNTLAHFSVETDEKGVFQTDCPDSSLVTFTAHLPSQARAFYRARLPDADHLFGLQTEFTMAFLKPVEFEGVLASPEGAPLAGAKLRFHPMSSNYLDDRSVPVALNLLCGVMPPDKAWDERCKGALFLTDCELVTNAAGEFHAHSITGGINYTIEVIREGQERALLDFHTRGLKDKVPLQLRR